MNERSTSTLAATKLRAPTPPTRLIDRSRLATVLRDANAADLPLVLVSAPAGSGKSTLVAGWAAAHRGSVAWLQLEESDSDPARFWISVTAAIGALHAEIGDRLGPVLAGSFGIGEVVVPALVNEVESLPGRLIVVLDDYHLIDAVEVQRGVERFIDLCPPNLTIVLITRADPPFRLGRMRVRGRVREIRGSDLRFDSAEAAALLGSAAAGLTAQRLDDLCARTEGWAAGLVLAGLSLERVDDADRFVDTFGGDDQLIVGYLTDEMLARLDPDERTRIVEAAVLHRLSGPLLDAVTGSDDGARWLDALASRNQLVIRLDAVGEWYRYHHLLRDMLLLEARRSIPDRLPDLHRRAAAWFETSDHPAAAVDHRLAAGDREQAMRLMRVVGPDLLGSGELRILRNILGRLSAGGELDATCLALSGWDHYLTGRYDRARQLLDSALASLPADVDPMRLMPLRINIALGTGDVGEALSGARDVVANGDLEAQPSELITAAMAAFAWAGLSDEALAILPTALARTRAEHRTTAHGMSLVAAAVVEFHRADPATALAAAQRALDFAGTSGLGAYHGIAPALAIRAAMTPGASAQSDAEQAVALARRATTRLGLVFVLTLAGDVLLRDDGAMLRAGGEDGRALIDEAQRIIETCADPGIALPILERVAARHRVVRPRAVPTNGLVEILSERELAVLRYLLRPEEVGVVTCRGRVWRFGVRVDWACRVLGVRVVQFVSMRAAILTRLWLKMPWPHQVRAPSMPV